MNQRVDELKKVADKIEQQVNSAADHWCALTDPVVIFRPSDDILAAAKER